MVNTVLGEFGGHVKTGRIFVVDNIGPINTVVVFTTIVLVPILDVLRPWSPTLGAVVASLVAVCLVALLVAKALGKPAKVVLPGAVLSVLAVCAGLFCAGAIASSRHAQQGGVIAGYSATVKSWQDAWLVSIKDDTKDIRSRTSAIEQKVDQQSFMLAQVLASMRPQYEKVLAEEVKGFDKLPANQKDALVLLTSKVGTNGIKRYKRLTKAVELYAQDPSANNRHAIEDSTRYVVQLNSNTIEDTKTRLQVLAMFFEPETFNYLIGAGPAPSSSQLLALFNIDPSKPAAAQVQDPLGDFMAAQQAKGVQVVEKVVVPRSVETSDGYRAQVIRDRVRAASGF